jgi:hypothetical protein
MAALLDKGKPGRLPRGFLQAGSLHKEKELVMNGKGMFRLPILLAALGVCWPSVATAAPPWNKLLGQSQVEADPNKTYTIREDNGPYLIIACSYSGENSEKQAKELCLELRKKYKLEAYCHKVHFKLDDPNGPNAEQSRSPVRWQYRQFTERPDQYKDGAVKEVAVLVGNFPAMDDPEAQKTLKKIKHADPDCLKNERAGTTSRTLAVLRYFQRQVTIEGNQMKDLGPMGHAFLTTNPLLPPDYYAPKGVVDELVLKMNKNVEHSLLDCPGKYTVQVARFTGQVTINQRDIQEIQNDPTSKKRRPGLAEAAEKAHTLTEALRMKKYEAYEFHDRYASIVTVGSFDSVGTPRADGKTEINPKIYAIIEQFRAKTPDLPNQLPGAMKMESLVGIYFDIQPIPVEVPKRSISRELARRVTTEDE